MTQTMERPVTSPKQDLRMSHTSLDEVLSSKEDLTVSAARRYADQQYRKDVHPTAFTRILQLFGLYKHPSHR